MMGAIRKITIELANEVAVNIDRAVATGQYADVDAVVQHALRLFLQTREDENARLRAAWEEGLASGEPIDMPDDFFEDIIRRGNERLAARAAE
ncbi:type II toxin-antitoxin system ParD family antitoxin [Sphingomonas sp. S1-29]|uniref:ribbon-helix-helix domain-containing protein n=1 Tax=Sphingomonas sp. S1-29 TaxID=2991074 RepID=UPI00223EFC63|nr:type II toxin-antitoxin system ParD family antitoxin [Sphingomonas sp. S1-29]UZK69462.1 type II toxin-antitoxin system ParD family antitoxin [Sphingomonas sp. S1-29]